MSLSENRWIKCKNELPDPMIANTKIINVLFVVEGEVYKGIFFTEHKTFDESPSSDQIYGNSFKVEEVTEWMYLPKPSK